MRCLGESVPTEFLTLGGAGSLRDPPGEGGASVPTARIRPLGAGAFSFGRAAGVPCLAD